MEYKVTAKNVKISPRKMRLVTDAVKELSLIDAISRLAVLDKRAATPLRKALESAVSNAGNVSQVKKEDLKVRYINITEGIKYKRHRYAGRGRIRPYVKRASHINIVLEDNETKEQKPKSKKTDEKQEDKTKRKEKK